MAADSGAAAHGHRVRRRWRFASTASPSVFRVGRTAGTPKSRVNPVATAALGVGLAVALAIVAMWATGLMNGQNAAAGLVFGGTLLTGAVSFVGLALKNSADLRAAAERSREEDRLRLEAGLRAAALLSTAAGQPADPATTTTALLSLLRLHQSELAATG